VPKGVGVRVPLPAPANQPCSFSAGFLFVTIDKGNLVPRREVYNTVVNSAIINLISTIHESSILNTIFSMQLY